MSLFFCSGKMHAGRGCKKNPTGKTYIWVDFGLQRVWFLLLVDVVVVDLRRLRQAMQRDVVHFVDIVPRFPSIGFWFLREGAGFVGCVVVVVVVVVS